MTADGTIVVINAAASEAENLKELIEFMDAPTVRTGTPGEWREQIGDGRLDAVFVGADLTESEVRTVVGDVAELDPNVPIVMLREGEEQE